MFVWLGKVLTWTGRKIYDERADRYDVYDPGERQIFAYFNGAEVVKADPLAIYKRLMAEHADIYVESKVAASIHKDAKKAQESLAARIRRIFDLKPLDGIRCEGTLTDVEVQDLLDAFYIFCGSVKKNSNLTRTSPTATSGFTNSSPDTSPPTTSSSVSGSTGVAPPTAEPRPSTSGPASPPEPSSPASISSDPSPTEKEKPN